MPMTGLPPNCFMPDHAIRAGRKVKAVFIRIVAIVRTLGSIWTPNELMQLMKPLKRPVATRTGMTGIKMSPRMRDSFLGSDMPAYRSALMSVFTPP